MNHNSNFFPPNTTPFKYAKKKVWLDEGDGGVWRGGGRVKPHVTLDNPRS